jgi:uncharacterized membrane protein YuzA (DUF378 family)
MEDTAVWSDLSVWAASAIVFVAQFMFIMLKGLQQINVVAGRVAVAGWVSLGLGITGLITLDILANSLVNGAHWSVYASYLLSGVLGIWAAMWLERVRSKRSPIDPED